MYVNSLFSHAHYTIFTVYYFICRHNHGRFNIQQSTKYHTCLHQYGMDQSHYSKLASIAQIIVAIHIFTVLLKYNMLLITLCLISPSSTSMATNQNCMVISKFRFFIIFSQITQLYPLQLHIEFQNV